MQVGELISLENPPHNIALFLVCGTTERLLSDVYFSVHKLQDLEGYNQIVKLSSGTKTTAFDRLNTMNFFFFLYAE